MLTSPPNAIRVHDAATGSEVWRLYDGTQAKVPTTVVAGDLVIVTA